ncbi:MAG: mechanosensitive ion channel [Armatimonadota bacterium]|nr:mechanosensitive ion channel [Armatimonadota bacterium]
MRLPANIQTVRKLWDAEHWSEVWFRHVENALTAATRIIVILVAYFLVRFVLLRVLARFAQSMLAKAAKDRLVAREARIRSLQTLLGSTVSFVLGFVAVVMILQAAGINVVPLLTTASVAGIAVGFGAQKLVRDWIAGLFILIEDQYGVGDIVTIGGVTGTVEELGMRTTRIRGEDGSLYIIPNGDISQVCNRSRPAE